MVPTLTRKAGLIMKHRSLLAACAALTLLLAPGPKASAANVSFSLRIGDPYRGPSLAFVEQPDIVVIPGTRVYYVDDYNYDLYGYGNYWYYYYDGGWYRSADYDGPFYFIGYQSVPYSIRYIPVRYRHHWRNYRGPAYSYYQAGRYYRSNPANYTSYRTRTYENRSYTQQYPRQTQTRYRQDTQAGYRQQTQRQSQPQPQPVQQGRYQRDQRPQQQAPPAQQNQGGGNRGGGKGKGHGKGQDKGNGGSHGHGQTG
jgi:hypothetical protein